MVTLVFLVVCYWNFSLPHEICACPWKVKSMAQLKYPSQINMHGPSCIADQYAWAIHVFLINMHGPFMYCWSICMGHSCIADQYAWAIHVFLINMHGPFMYCWSICMGHHVLLINMHGPFMYCWSICMGHHVLLINMHGPFMYCWSICMGHSCISDDNIKINPMFFHISLSIIVDCIKCPLTFHQLIWIWTLNIVASNYITKRSVWWYYVLASQTLRWSMWNYIQNMSMTRLTPKLHSLMTLVSPKSLKWIMVRLL